MSLRMIGVHIQNEQVAVQHLRNCPVATCVDCSPTYLQDVRGALPADSWLVVRTFYDPQRLENPIGEAARWMDGTYDMRQALRGVARTVFQGYNEISDDMAAPYLQFELERFRLMRREGSSGFGAIAASVGTPDYPKWALWRALLQGLDPKRDAVLLHEYWARPSWLEDQHIICRFTQHEPTHAIGTLPIIISETGRDKIWIDGKAYGWAGWKGRVSREGYLMELAEYGKRLLQARAAGYNVVGATVFTLGKIWDQWKAFDANELLPALKEAWGPAEPIVTYRPPLATSEPLSAVFDKAPWHVEETIRCIEGGRLEEAIERLWALRDYIRKAGVNG